MNCPACFQAEGDCYLSCPLQCPWGGDHVIEDQQSQPDAIPPDQLDPEEY